jgi:large subunit ribosomal protein L25
MKTLVLRVARREELGRGPSKRLRREGFIPAVVYGKSGVEHLRVASDVFREMMRERGDRAALIELNIDDRSKKISLLQEIVRDFCSDHFQHIDFKEIDENEEMVAILPVHLKGEAHGVKNEGGVIEFTTHAVEVRCLPKNLPDAVELDISELKVGQSVHVQELPTIEGVSYTHGDIVVVACTKVEEEEKEGGVADTEAKTPASAATSATS